MKNDIFTRWSLSLIHFANISSQIDKEYVRYSSSVGLLKSWAVSRNSEIQIQDVINHDSVQLEIMQRYTNFSLAYFSFDIKSKYF